MISSPLNQVYYTGEVGFVYGQWSGKGSGDYWQNYVWARPATITFRLQPARRSRIGRKLTENSRLSFFRDKRAGADGSEKVDRLVVKTMADDSPKAHDIIRRQLANALKTTCSVRRRRRKSGTRAHV